MSNLYKIIMQNKGIAIICLGVSLLLLATESSFADGGGLNFNQIATFLDSVYLALTGNIAKSIFTLAIVAVGFMFLLGRMDWMFALTIVIGVGILYAAGTIAGMMSGGAAG